ncbi:MAG: GNAT family N-acyltransferase [Thermodesulfobacteriota bacterium]
MRSPSLATAAREPSPALATAPTVRFRQGRYQVRFARTPDELDQALRLRFAVFNVELGEGLRDSVLTGRDEDPFDAQCHHLLVEDVASASVVGTYRLQTSAMAAAGRGFHTATEFDLSVLPGPLLAQSVELGRACIARPHRNTRVLFLLWRGIGEYARRLGKRWLFGCCSLTSQEPRDGLALLDHLAARGALHDGLRVRPRPGYACLTSVPRAAAPAVAVPRLFDMYLAMGAKVCSEPALDRAFRTIDFLVLCDLAALGERDRRRFLAPARTVG